MCEAALSSPLPGEVFTATVHALMQRDGAFISRLLSLVEAVPEARAGLDDAFGWVPASQLRGITKALLDSHVPSHRASGLQACRHHGVEPGRPARDGHHRRRRRPARHRRHTAGALRRTDLLPAALRALSDPDEPVRFEAARAALWFGERHQAPAALHALARAPGASREAALSCWAKVAATADVHALFKALSADPAAQRPPRARRRASAATPSTCRG